MAVKVKIDWKGAQFQRRLIGEVEARMVQGENYARRIYQSNVGRQYPPAGAPGGFPARRAGTLQRGVRTNVNRIGVQRVRLTISNIARSKRGFPYPVALEKGTRFMAARPHLRPTLRAVWLVIRRLLRAS